MEEIKVMNLRVRTGVVGPHELGETQELLITIQMMLSLKKAGASVDQIGDTAEYKTIIKEITALVESKQYNMIEAVAADVARVCVVRHNVPEVRVTVNNVTIIRRPDDFDYQDVHISIGSNIQPKENIPKAIELLKKKSQVVRLSSAFVTPPEKYYDQADFVNMAVLVRTKLDAEGLKLFFYEIEEELGRKRDPENKNGPNPIDLDIAFWGDKVLEYKLVIGGTPKSWRIPHPEITTFAHVIVPLAEISPFFVHPTQNQSLKSIAQKITGYEQFSTFFPTISLQNETAASSSKTKVLAVMNEALTDTNRNNVVHGTVNPVALIPGESER